MRAFTLGKRPHHTSVCPPVCLSIPDVKSRTKCPGKLKTDQKIVHVTRDLIVDQLNDANKTHVNTDTIQRKTD